MGRRSFTYQFMPASVKQPEERIPMKEMQCKDCGKNKNVPDDTREPFICDACMELHKENEAQDFDLEQELERDANWDYEAKAELDEIKIDRMIDAQIEDAILERLEKKELKA